MPDDSVIAQIQPCASLLRKQCAEAAGVLQYFSGNLVPLLNSTSLYPLLHRLGLSNLPRGGSDDLAWCLTYSKAAGALKSHAADFREELNRVHTGLVAGRNSAQDWLRTPPQQLWASHGGFMARRKWYESAANEKQIEVNRAQKTLDVIQQINLGTLMQSAEAILNILPEPKPNQDLIPLLVSPRIGMPVLP
jgi:hypothetical protein